MAKRLLIPIAALVAVVYWFPVRRWFSRWGTTPEELARAMPGDALIPNPTEMSMQAVTVNAGPEDIWPWLVQIGYQRPEIGEKLVISIRTVETHRAAIHRKLNTSSRAEAVAFAREHGLLEDR